MSRPNMPPRSRSSRPSLQEAGGAVWQWMIGMGFIILVMSWLVGLGSSIAQAILYELVSLPGALWRAEGIFLHVILPMGIGMGLLSLWKD